ncbi:Transcriptional regulator, LuxR family [metagenome]|uniref:Transcriptional regulator, LuxR family n=1 Tax=metagenome TaxID=256318 RepID=A0A2P2C9F9_9ZZZZ
MRLLEREAELGLLRAALDVALAGQGCGVAIAGDSGLGKSTLIDALCTEVDVPVLRSHCDPLDTPRPLGPFRDLDLVGDPRDRATTERPLPEVCEEVFEQLRSRAAVLVVEDLHWVDAASVDVLRFLARRLESMPVLLILSYRDAEIGPRHSARTLLGDIASLDTLSQLSLAPLSVDGVREMLDGTQLSPDRVHSVTGGNPFFVAEVSKEPDLPLPRSVRDAVLAHTVDVTLSDLEVLQLIATAPDRLDDRALPALGVDLPTLRRLHDTSLLSRVGSGLVFRHELARQAIEGTVPAGGGPRLHARLLEALEQIEPHDAAVLTHHAVGARDRGRAASYARAAGEEATRAGSHSEAAAFFLTALENLDSTDPRVRAELLHQLAHEQYMTSQLREAIDNIRATFPLWEEAGDAGGLASAHDAVALYEYYSARRRQAELHSELAVDIARAQPGVEYGAARATQGFLAYLRSDLDGARNHAAEAHRVAGLNAASSLELRSEVVRAVTDLVSGDTGARADLLQHLDAARARGLDELASTAYSQASSLDVEHGRYREADQLLQVSIPFATQRDIPICRHWQTGVRSRLRLQQGRWEAALEDASEVLDGEGMPLATLWPRLVSLLIPMRREGVVDRAALDDVWALVGQIAEPLRRLSVLSALAEVAWMTQEPDPRVTEYAVSEVHDLPALPGAEWGTGQVAVWLHRMQLPVPPATLVAEPFALTLEGRHRDAAQAWRELGDPFAEAMAWTDSADVDDQVRGIRLLDGLGAVATADRHRVVLRQEGHSSLPQRPRVSTRANPAGLTNRQLDVARLVGQGLSNAEIAQRLYISTKTADHHVSAILAKLGVPSRRAVVVNARDLGLD